MKNIKTHYWLLIAVGLFSTVFYSCRNEYFSDNCLHFQINGRVLEIPLHGGNLFYDVETLNSEFPNTVVLLNKIKGKTVFLNGKKLTPNITFATGMNATYRAVKY